MSTDKPKSITGALDLDKLKSDRRNEEAWSILQRYSTYSEDLKKKNQEQFEAIRKRTENLRYENLTEEQKREGGPLFKALEKMRIKVDLSHVWPKYGLIVDIASYSKNNSTVRVPVSRDQPKEGSDNGGNALSYLMRKNSNPRASEQYKNLLLSADWYMENHKEKYEKIKREMTTNTIEASKIPSYHRHYAPDLFKLVTAGNQGASNALSELALLTRIQELRNEEKENSKTSTKLPKKPEQLTQREEKGNISSEKAAMSSKKATLVVEGEGISFVIQQYSKQEKDKGFLKEALKEFQSLQVMDEELKKHEALLVRRERWEGHGDEAKNNYVAGLDNPTRPLHILLAKAVEKKLKGSTKAFLEYGKLLFTETLLNSKDTPNVRPPSAATPKTPEYNKHNAISYQRLIELEKEFHELQEKSRFQESQIDELTSRLSQFASQQLSNANPNVADLSDIHRPTKIGERFGLLFDDEWSEAFEALKDSLSPQDLYRLFVDIVRDSFGFCKHAIEKHKKNVEEELKRLATEPKVSDKNFTSENRRNKVLEAVCQRYTKDFTKASAPFTVPAMCQIYKDTRLTIIASKMDKRSLQSVKFNSYVNKAVELTYLMCVQDPPMELVIAKPGSEVSKELLKLFKLFHKSGQTVDICVWPALRLHENGPTVVKGHVQAK